MYKCTKCDCTNHNKWWSGKQVTINILKKWYSTNQSSFWCTYRTENVPNTHTVQLICLCTTAQQWSLGPYPRWVTNYTAHYSSQALWLSKTVFFFILSSSSHSFSQINANENREVKFDLKWSNEIHFSCIPTAGVCILAISIYNQGTAYLHTWYQKWSHVYCMCMYMGHWLHLTGAKTTNFSVDNELCILWNMSELVCVS